MQEYPIPILFVVFNRPDIAMVSFNEIKKVRPMKLYLASDAPRIDKPGEDKLVQMTRQKILGSIDWDCDVKTLFQNENLGCGKGVYTAIDWFFKNEEKGIILEDDCVVNTSFFIFMQELLVQYAFDNRVGMIAGTNPLSMYDVKTSYVFSKYKSCWGWATWRRAWVNMDLEMKWRDTSFESVLRNSTFYGKDYKWWKYKIKCIDEKYVSAWDWQWYFSLSAQNQLCIYPASNLVSNIGNDSAATHTSYGNITLERFPIKFPLVHPKFIMPQYEFDKMMYKKSYSLSLWVKMLLPFSWKRFIKGLISR